MRLITFFFYFTSFFLDWSHEIASLVWILWLVCVKTECWVRTWEFSMLFSEWKGTRSVQSPRALLHSNGLPLWVIYCSPVWAFFTANSFNFKAGNSSQEKSPWRFLVSGWKPWLRHYFQYVHGIMVWFFGDQMDFCPWNHSGCSQSEASILGVKKFT